MEFKQVMGNRRSIRYFEPDKPVEKEKIQYMLEADEPVLPGGQRRLRARPWSSSGTSSTPRCSSS